MINFLSWIRFVVYDGDLDVLYDRVTDALEKAKRAAIAKGQRKFGSIGDYVQPIDIATEKQVWAKVKVIVGEALAKYPTTLE